MKNDGSPKQYSSTNLKITTATVTTTKKLKRLFS